MAVVTAYTPSPALSTGNSNPNINFRQFVQLTEDSRGALRVTFKAGPGGMSIDGASFGKWDGVALDGTHADMTTTPFRLTFSGANGSGPLGNLVEITTDFILHPGVTLNAGDWIIVAWKCGNSFSGDQYYSSGHTTALAYYNLQTTDLSQDQTCGASGSISSWAESGSAGQPGNANGRNFSVALVETSTIWDENTFSGGTLSYDRLVFTDNTGTGTVISTTTKSSAKKAAKVTFNAGAATGASIAGVTTTSSDVTGTTSASYMLVYAPGSGYGLLNNSGLLQGFDNATTAPTGLNDVITVLLDRTANKLYFQVNGNNVFGADPVAGTGGATVSASSFFIGVSTATSTITATADFSPTSLPSGWTAWDAAGGGGPTSYTLTADRGQFNITGQAAGTLLGPYWTYVGKTEAAVNASGNYTLTEPSGVQQGDVLVVDFAARSTVIYANADWTFPQSDITGNTTNNTTGSKTSYQTGYCIRGASPPSYSFTRTGGSRALGTVRAYRSSRAGTPSFDTSAEVSMGAASTTVTLTGGVTTTAIDELIVTAVYGARANTVSNMDGTTEVTGNSGATDTTTPPVFGTWTERSDRNNGTSPTVALACYDTIKRTAGSTGNLVATESQSALHGMTAMAFKHPAASGAPYTLTADRGIFAITGVAAGLKRGLKTAGAAGAYAITGQTAGLKVGKKVGASVGTFAITGQAAGLRRTLAVIAALGTYSISGQAAGLKAGKRLTAALGTISVTGQAANFRRTYAVAANTGSFAITGQTAGLRTTKGITALHGAFAITGQTAGLKTGRKVGATAGSYAITGQAANLVYNPVGANITMSADVGTFTISGQNAELDKGSKVTAAAGAFTISGQSAILKIGKSLGASSGTYSITGQDVILTRTTDVNFEPGAFNITGQDANLKVGRGTAAATGSYQITGQDVTFSLGGTGAYSLLAESAYFGINGKPAELLYGIKAGGIVLIRQHYTKVKSSPPKLPERTFDKVHPVEEIRKAAARLSSTGGHARAAALTQKQRTQIASNAAKARWR